jgi:hypothetical protein
MNAIKLAVQFHEIYERLAPNYGYETRTETRAFDTSTPNGKLMVAVCREIIQTVFKPILDERDKEIERLTKKVAELRAAYDRQVIENAELKATEQAAYELVQTTTDELLAERKAYAELKADRDRQVEKTSGDRITELEQAVKVRDRAFDLVCAWADPYDSSHYREFALAKACEEIEKEKP